MKFLADANVPQSVITALLRKQHDVLDIKQLSLSARDTEIVAKAQQEARIILTRDKDFITLLQFPKYQVPTIVIRLKNQTPHHMAERLLELIDNQQEAMLTSSLTIVSEEIAHSYPYEK